MALYLKDGLWNSQILKRCWKNYIMSDYSKIRYQKLKKEGKCTVCNKPVQIYGHIHCNDCKIKSKNIQTLYLKDKKDKKLCPACGNPAEKNVRCNKCTEKYDIHNTNKRTMCIENKLCIACKLKIDSGTFCDECRSKVRDKRKLLKSQNLCVHCQEPSMNNKTMCLECLISKTANRAGITYLEAIEIWEEQNGICPYSGRKLELGIDASLDHTLAKSKGGLNIKNNLKWVHINVNRAKSNLSIDELLSLCNDIINNMNKENSND